MKVKRLIIATLLGLLFGFVCYGLASSGTYEVSGMLAVSIIFGRTLIGVAIGISRFQMKHWALHGIVLGFLFSLPAGFGAISGPENPEFTHTAMFFATIISGMVYGFLIEFITSILLKAKQ